MNAALPGGRAPERHAGGRFCAAFTLIELLVVIAIIAMLAVIVMPAVHRLTLSNSRAQAVNQVRAYLSLARGTALSGHSPTGVVFFQETPQYALPVHGDQVAMQMFTQDSDQSRLVHHPNNTIFVPVSSARSYLPAGIAVAVLNDDLKRGVTVGDESSSVSKTRAILFDAGGQVWTRHGVARENLPYPGQAGTYPYAEGDWKFATQGTPPSKTSQGSDSSSQGVSSPGIFLFDARAYAARNIPTDNSAASNAARNNWIKQNATLLTINANTGELSQCD